MITNLTGAMARRYVCKGCNEWFRQDVTNVCDQKCSDWKASPPCAFKCFRIPCAECKRNFRSRSCFNKHKISTLNKKSLWERKRFFATCGVIVTLGNHECNNRHCETCNQNREVGHLYYIRPLKNVLPANVDNVLYVLYDIETTQNTRYSDKAKAHVPKLCLKSM